MKTLKEYILDAEKKHIALGHFNISNVEGFWAVVNAAKRLGAPVIIGVSEGERDFIGVEQVKALVDTIKKTGQPIFLNADHTYTLDRAREVMDAGYDSVIIDLADRPFEGNVSVTKEVSTYAKSKNPAMLVEAELGFIGKSSKILDKAPEILMTDPEEAGRFVRETNIDLFAPAVGNIHGMLRGGDPKLDIQRISAIKEATGVPLVLHGASGNSDEEIQQAISAGISIIHINTELRVAYRNGVEKGLSENPNEVAPYKYLKDAVEEMQKVVEKKLVLFSNS